MKHSQVKSSDFETFLRRSDELAARTRKNLENLASDMGFSRASFWGYRTGKRPISAKAWRVLEKSEQEAGIHFETFETPPDPSETSPRISDSEIKDVNAELFELCVRPIYQAKDEADLWIHHHLLVGRAQKSPNDLWITLLFITLQEIQRWRAVDAKEQAAKLLSKLPAPNQQQSQ